MNPDIDSAAAFDRKWSKMLDKLDVSERDRPRRCRCRGQPHRPVHDRHVPAWRARWNCSNGDMSRSRHHGCGRSCGLCRPHKRFKSNRRSAQRPAVRHSTELHDQDIANAEDDLMDMRWTVGELSCPCCWLGQQAVALRDIAEVQPVPLRWTLANALDQVHTCS